MSATTFGWLILLFPLLGMIIISIGFRRSVRHQRRVAGHAGHRAGLRRDGVRADLDPRPAGDAPRADLQAVGLRRQRRGGRPALDPRGPAVDLHGARGVGDLDPHFSLLDRLHEVRPGLQPVLRLPQLLRLLDAAAGAGGQLPAADRRLGGRRRGVLPAHLVLVPADHCDLRRHQGVRHQRFRRRRAGAGHLLHLPPHRQPGLPEGLRRRPPRVQPQQHRPGGGLPAAAGRRVRQVRSGPAAHLASGRHGGPDAGVGAHPRRHHGDRGRLPHRPHAPALRDRHHRRRCRRGSSAA